MKTSDTEMVEAYEETALEGMRHVRMFLVAADPGSLGAMKAKIGAMAMGAYTRLRATRANERALLMAAKRQQLRDGAARELPANDK